MMSAIEMETKVMFVMEMTLCVLQKEYSLHGNVLNQVNNNVCLLLI